MLVRSCGLPRAGPSLLRPGREGVVDGGVDQPGRLAWPLGVSGSPSRHGRAGPWWPRSRLLAADLAVGPADVAGGDALQPPAEQVAGDPPGVGLAACRCCRSRCGTGTCGHDHPHDEAACLLDGRRLEGDIVDRVGARAREPASASSMQWNTSASRASSPRHLLVGFLQRRRQERIGLDPLDQAKQPPPDRVRVVAEPRRRQYSGAAVSPGSPAAACGEDDLDDLGESVDRRPVGRDVVVVGVAPGSTAA